MPGDLKDRIDADLNWVRNNYGERDSRFSKYHRWYNMRHYEDDPLVADEFTPEADPGTIVERVPSGEVEHLETLPLIGIFIDNAHTIITTGGTNIQVVLSGRESSTEKTRASKVERALHGVYYINSQVSGSDPVTSAVFNQLLFGWGVLYSVWDPTRGEKVLNPEADLVDYPDYDFPVIVRSVDPRQIYAVPGGKREQFRTIFNISERTVLDIADEWDMEPEEILALLNKKKIQEDRITDINHVVEYQDVWLWDGDTVVHAVRLHGAEEYLKEPTVMEEYDFLPYTIFFCRHLDMDFPENYGLSLLFNYIEPVKELENVISRVQRALDLYADPQLVIEAGVDQDVDTIDKRPGSIIVLGSGGRAYYLSYAGSPPDAGAMVNLFRDLIQEAGFANVTTGVEGGASGLDTISLQQGSLLRVDTPRRNAEAAVQAVNGKVVTLMRSFLEEEQSLMIRGVRAEKNEEHPFSLDIKAKDFKGLRYTWVRIRPQFPQAQLRNAAIAQGLVSAGLYEDEQAMDDLLYVQDPGAMKRKMRRNTIMDHPAIPEFFIQRMLARMQQQDMQNQVVPQPEEGEEPPGAGEVPAPPPTGAEPPIPPAATETPPATAANVATALQEAAQRGGVLPRQMEQSQQARNLAAALQGRAKRAER